MNGWFQSGNAAPAHPCVRGICVSIHVIDVKGWVAPVSSDEAAA